MITPGLRWLVGVITDPVTGVNMQLPNLPRPGGQDPPPAVLYYSELEHPWAARGVVHRDALRNPGTKKPQPGLIIRAVLPEDGISIAVLPEFRDAATPIVPYGVFYAARKVESENVPSTNAVQMRDGYDTLRAVMRCVANKFDDAHTSYEVDDCTIQLPTSGIIIDNGFAETTDDVVLGRVIVPLIVEDRWALGIS